MEADDPSHSLPLLDEEERERAARFRFERDRDRFVTHHAHTRRVLARYLGVAPAAVVFEVGPNGKPGLDATSGIAFNTSRSGGLSVVAVSRGHVGIDVERVRPIDDALPLADGLFTKAERRSLGGTPSSARDPAFLALWTRKEAVVKAFGSGLSAPLDSFDVVASDGTQEPWQGQLGSEPFVVDQLDAPPGWVAAVAVPGTRLTIRPMHALERSR
jgi:4'-phosphopantetheinyl transferase